MSDRPLRVAITLEQCWHRVPGGTAGAALALARELARDPQLDVVGIAAAHRKPPAENWRPTVAVRHLPLPRQALYESWQLLRWPPVRRVDVIHATGIAMPPHSAPIVLTVHDLAFVHFPEHFTRAGLRFFNRNLELARREADLVLCSSLATLADCRAAGFDASRLRHVPLGVHAEPADDVAVERVRQAYGLERPFILWTGTLEPRKNLPRLLDAYGGLDADVDLVLVGPPGWKEDVERRIAVLPERARGRVRRLGFVPASDIGPLYAGASVFCFPSLLEGFGFPVLEAMTQGTPVVTSEGTSTAELAGGAGLLVDPRDPAAIARALERALTDEPLAERLGRAGPARAAEYTWTRSAQLVRDAYLEVAQ